MFLIDYPPVRRVKESDLDTMLSLISGSMVLEPTRKVSAAGMGWQPTRPATRVKRFTRGVYLLVTKDTEDRHRAYYVGQSTNANPRMQAHFTGHDFTYFFAAILLTVDCSASSTFFGDLPLDWWEAALIQRIRPAMNRNSVVMDRWCESDRVARRLAKHPKIGDDAKLFLHGVLFHKRADFEVPDEIRSRYATPLSVA